MITKNPRDNATQRKASFTDPEWTDIITRANLPNLDGKPPSDSNMIRAALGLPPLVRGGSTKGREIKVSRRRPVSRSSRPASHHPAKLFSEK